MEKEIQINVKRCLREVFRKTWLILIVGIVMFGIAYALTLTPEVNVYGASATVYSAAEGSYSDSMEGSNAIRVYSDVVTSKKVAQRAAELLDDPYLTAEMIQSMITTTYSTTSTIMIVEAHSINQTLAIKTANAVAASFVIEIQGITGTNSIQMLDEATTSYIFSNSNAKQMQKRLLAFAAGILVTAVIIFVVEAFSPKANSISEISMNGNLELLGSIPAYQKK